MIFSHTHQTLAEHLNGLRRIADQLIQFKTQHLFNSGELNRLLFKLIAFHDTAKATTYFQWKITNAIRKENGGYYQTNQNEIDSFIKDNLVIESELKNSNDLGYHAHFGAVSFFTHYVDEEITVDNLLWYEILRRHHGNLKDFKPDEFVLDEQQFDVINAQLRSLFIDQLNKSIKDFGETFQANRFTETVYRLKRGRKINQVIDELGRKNDLTPFLKLTFIYSMLLSADKGDVMLSKDRRSVSLNPIPSKIIDCFKEIIDSSKPIDRLRQKAYETIIDRINGNHKSHFFSITLPTGLGKTFAALKAALLLRETGGLQHFHIIYCLPFTSIIDQNASLLEEILKHNNQSSGFMARHHHLSPFKTKDKTENEITYDEAEYFTEGWQQEIIVTTFVQLLESVFTNRNSTLRKFHNLSNSIIILDEVQNIPPSLIEAIEKVFVSMAEKFGTRFLFVTATQPMILEADVIELTGESESETKGYFDQMSRITIDQSALNENVTSLEQLLDDIKRHPKKTSQLIILNTVKQAQDFYRLCVKEFQGRNIYHLSGSMIPHSRLEVIKEIMGKIKNKTPQLLISTQVVEAGVDIDFDIVYRDFAPLDSIFQSAGRCNRNGLLERGRVYLFDAGKSLRIYDSVLINITKEVLKNYGNIIEENQFYSLGKEYFKLLKERKQSDADESAKWLKCMYTLQMEQLGKFRLIKDDVEKVLVYIPINEHASKIWKDYEEVKRETNHFIRKKKMNSLLPDLMQYVAKFPKWNYTIPSGQEETFIIYDDNWEEWYDVNYGFHSKTSSGKNSPSSVII